MSMSRMRRALWVVGIVGAGVFVAWLRRPVPVVIAMPPESEVEATVRDGGTTYKVFRGDAYVVGPGEGELTGVDHLYDPGFFAANYRVVGGVPNKLDRGTGKLYPTRRRFEEGFEDAASVRDLIGEARGWTGFTLQSPMAPEIPDYNDLRRKIVQEEGDFLDNRIGPTAERARSGKQSLKCVCVPKSRAMVTAKASLSTSLIHFAKGDDLWFSAWYFVPDAASLPLTLVDIESTWIKEHPGLRLMFEDDGALMFELKWAGKPKYRQPPGRRMPFPIGRWVELRIHAKLSDGPDGLVELWQDGDRLIQASGQTLPLASTIYDDLEIGISAHSAPGRTAVVFVDDMRLGDVE